MRIGSKENRRPRPPEDFEAQLQLQMNFLERSCAMFDAGIFDEAIRIATTIRTLVYRTGRSTSLLSHLGVQDKLQFVDTGVYRSLLDPALQRWIEKVAPGSRLASTSPTDVGLVELRPLADGRAGWFAPLSFQRFAAGTPSFEACRVFSAFDAWWTDPLIESSSGKSFSRCDVVMVMADQDGGAHVDAALDADYADFVVDDTGGYEHGTDLKDKTMNGEIPPILNNVAFASVRQIAFELLETLKRYLYVKNNGGPEALQDPASGIPHERSSDGMIGYWGPVIITISN